MSEPSPSAARWFSAALAGVLALGLAARLFYVAQWHETRLFDVFLGDGLTYSAWATGIAAGDWWGSDVFYQAPLYPYLLGLEQILFGNHPLVPRAVQAILGSLSCVLLALAARRFFSDGIAIGAGAALALYPPAIFFDGLIQKASLALFLLTAVLALIGQMRARPRAASALALGATLGLLGLTRENALALVPLVGLWLWFGLESSRRVRLMRIILLAAGLAAILLPVGARNLMLGGSLQLTTSQLGPNFYIGNHAGADGRYHALSVGGGDARRERHDARRLAESALGRALTPAEVSSYWLDRSLEFIRTEPVQWLRLIAFKSFLTGHSREIVDTDSIEAYADVSSILRVGFSLFHFGVLLPFAALGLWFTRSRWRELWVWYGIAVTIAASVAVFYVLARYRFSLVPVLLPFAAAGVAHLVRVVRVRDLRALVLPLLIVAPVALASNWPLDDGADPRATTLYVLGLRLAERGELSAATDTLKRANQIEPHNPYPLLGLAEIQRHTDDLEGQLVTLQRAHASNPDNAIVRQRLGNALTQLAYESSACVEEQLYDPARALELVREAEQLLGGTTPALTTARKNAEAALDGRTRDVRRVRCR